MHLDLKSANVLLDAYLRAKLADLGLAKAIDYNQANKLSGPCGTPAWMAPEMLEDEIKISTATDVYGLGLVMWEMKSAERPYANLNFEKVCQAIKAGVQLSMPAELSEDIKALILSCWRPEPNDRPSSEDILNRLNQMSFPDHWKALFGASPMMDTPIQGTQNS